MEEMFNKHFMKFIFLIPICGSVAICYFSRDELKKLGIFTKFFCNQLRYNFKNKKLKLTGELISNIIHSNNKNVTWENSLKISRALLTLLGISSFMLLLSLFDSNFAWWKIVLCPLFMYFSFLFLRAALFASDDELTFTVNLDNEDH